MMADEGGGGRGGGDAPAGAPHGATRDLHTVAGVLNPIQGDD